MLPVSFSTNKHTPKQTDLASPQTTGTFQRDGAVIIRGCGYSVTVGGSVFTPPRPAGIHRLNLSNRFSPVASAACARLRETGSGK